ncbi:aspartate/glutamate racemase family protein [Afifella sp. IM 167]|uniref:aspartate/glutamate racemase family protein n=1 Tax=Afifella sp. IM 167 TaxID=2033586 RepID=UPI001CCA395D|nr:aspartate/glutamate racemase family protein [Afifella sp. IM 167]MBZ8131822.1 hydantoin racemase [Afifella sp. IM 167]
MSRILMILTEGRSVAASAETELVTRLAEGLPKTLKSAHDWVLADIAVLAAGQGAEKEGFEAVSVGNAGDFGANALRSVLDIPVVAAGRSAFHYALTLGSSFGILTPRPVAHRAKKLVQEYGLAAQCAGVRGFSPDAGEDEIAKAAEALVAEDHADVVVLDGGLGGGLDGDAVRRLADRLPVPLVEPASLSVELAESFLGLGLSQSRRTYPMPQVPKPELVELMAKTGWGA